MFLSDAVHAQRALPAIHRASDISNNPFAAFVTEASKRGGPEHWIRAVLQVESGGKLQARPQKGAMEVMQIMPKTWAELRARYGLGADPYDPRQHVDRPGSGVMMLDGRINWSFGLETVFGR
jgi:soluble lytic murein transglycosylase-like protein